MKTSLCLTLCHFIALSLADEYNCSADPTQQPYRRLTNDEFINFAGGVIDDMFQETPKKREESLITYPYSAKYNRRDDGNGNGEDSPLATQQQPPLQQRLAAGDARWGESLVSKSSSNSFVPASLTPEQWDLLERGLRYAQEQTIHEVINAVGRHNAAVNQKALEAIEKIGQAAADSVKKIGDAVFNQVNYNGNEAASNVAAASRNLEEIFKARLQTGVNEWSAQIIQIARTRVASIANTVEEAVAGVIEATTDAVTAGSTSMDSRTPPRPFNGRFLFLNNTCRWLYWCGSKSAKAFRCFFLCNMNAGDRSTRTRTACSNFLQILSFGTVLIGGLVLLLNRLQIPIAPPDSNSTHSPLLPPIGASPPSNGSVQGHEVEVIPVTLNIRVEPRGPPPSDISVGPEPMITQLGNEALPEYAAKWLTHPTRKIDCVDSPNNNSTDQEHRRSRRDDPNDNRCLPTYGEDLQSLVWNLMWTQYFPQLDQGVMSASYSFYDEALEGSEDIYKGGAMAVHFWVTEKPDIDGMKAPPNNNNPSWSYRPHSAVYGQECFDTYFPANATGVTDGVPTKDWLFAFADACKNAFGGKGSVLPKDFIYAGKGYKGDSQNGFGFNGTYHSEGCNIEISCSDLVGINGDATSGDLDNHFNHCKQKTKDKKYHGGMFYHTADAPTRWKRDDPWVPSRCGYLQIEPLGEDGIEIQTKKNGKGFLGSDELR